MSGFTNPCMAGPICSLGLRSLGWWQAFWLLGQHNQPGVFRGHGFRNWTKLQPLKSPFQSPVVGSREELPAKLQASKQQRKMSLNIPLSVWMEAKWCITWRPRIGVLYVYMVPKTHLIPPFPSILFQKVTHQSLPLIRLVRTINL